MNTFLRISRVEKNCLTGFVIEMQVISRMCYFPSLQHFSRKVAEHPFSKQRSSVSIRLISCILQENISPPSGPTQQPSLSLLSLHYWMRNSTSVSNCSKSFDFLLERPYIMTTFLANPLRRWLLTFFSNWQVFQHQHLLVFQLRSSKYGLLQNQMHFLCFVPIILGQHKVWDPCTPKFNYVEDFKSTKLHIYAWWKCIANWRQHRLDKTTQQKYNLNPSFAVYNHI